VKLTSLRLQNFRRFSKSSWHFSPGLNLLIGENGSGKTSVLEAIHLFSTGRSFRGSSISQLLRLGESTWNVEAHFEEASLQDTRCFVGSEDGRSLRFSREGVTLPALTLAQDFPMQLLCSDTFRWVEGGGGFRRPLLNWGCFFSEPDFMTIWHRFTGALKQRNALLKTGKGDRLHALALEAWDREYLLWAKRLDQAYRNYLDDLMPCLESALALFLPGLSFGFSFYPGWAEQEPLEWALAKRLSQDRRLGHTGVGPHRADLAITVEGRPARHHLSRGQTKLFVCALLLARAECLWGQRGCGSLVLLDDIGAELDAQALERLLNALSRLKGQVLMTALSSNNEKFFQKTLEIQIQSMLY